MRADVVFSVIIPVASEESIQEVPVDTLPVWGPQIAHAVCAEGSPLTCLPCSAFT